MIPTSASYYKYSAAGSAGGGESFVAPPLDPSPLPLPGVILSNHVVEIDGVPLDSSLWSYDSGTGEITITSELDAGSSVEIYRETPVSDSLVDYPVVQRYAPRTHNKSLRQIFLCLQDLWGAIKSLFGYVDSEVDILEESLDAEVVNLKAWVNAALASYFSSLGDINAPVVWTTTVNAGDTIIETPYRFTQGLLFFGGSTYALNDATQVTLDHALGYTRIILEEAALFTGTATLVTLSADVEAQAVWSGSISSGESTITVPDTVGVSVDSTGILIVGGTTWDLADLTLSDNQIDLPEAVVSDHNLILVLL